MSNNAKEYRRLDFSKLKFSENIKSTEEALKDIVPIQWSEEILSGKKQVTITKAEKDFENKCVKLEIFC